MNMIVCAVQEWFINIICCEKAVSSGGGMLVTSLTSEPFFKPLNHFIDAKQHGCAGSPAKPNGLKGSFQQGEPRAGTGGHPWYRKKINKSFKNVVYVP